MLVFVPEPVVDVPGTVVGSFTAFDELLALLGTLGAAALGETFCFVAGVGEPKLSYCCCAATMLLLIKKAATVRPTESDFIGLSFGL
jgi:hypothetical protein